MTTKSTKVEVQVSHPMEDVLDIESGTTTDIITKRTTTLVKHKEYDEKDEEIENQIQEIYDAAMVAFEDQMDEVARVEGKYKARNSEVAVQFLNAALNASKEKSTLKQHNDKIVTAKGKISKNSPHTNIIIANHTDLLKSILGENPTDPKVINPIVSDD